jgi:hypothetical protein
MPVPLVTFALVLWLWSSLKRPRDVAPFIAALGLFLLCYIGLGISIWPMVVPYQISLGRGLRKQNPGVSVDRHALPAAHHRDVHRLVVLGLSWQGDSKRRIPPLTLAHCA